MKSIFSILFLIFISVNSSFAQDTTDVKKKELDEQIKKILVVADSMFMNKNWDAALKYYYRVNSLSPNHEYANRQINEIRLLKRQETNDKTFEILNNAKNAQEKRTENSYYTR